MEDYPIRDIGIVYGIESEYAVHWLDRDLAQITVDGDVVMTFWSASPSGFGSADGVLDEASAIVMDIEALEEGADDDW